MVTVTLSKESSNRLKKILQMVINIQSNIQSDFQLEDLSLLFEINETGEIVIPLYDRG